MDIHHVTKSCTELSIFATKGYFSCIGYMRASFSVQFGEFLFVADSTTLEVLNFN